jgi:hypothetical protein
MLKHFSIPAKKWNPFNLDCAVKSSVVFASDEDHFWIGESKKIRIERRIFGQWAFCVTHGDAETEWVARDLDHAIRVVHKAQSRTDGIAWLLVAIHRSGSSPV